MTDPSEPVKPIVSVIIPVGTESDISLYKQIYAALAREDGPKEVLWVSSNQQLSHWIKDKKDARLIEPSEGKSSRGYKMQLGVAHAAGEICLFHHPRSLMGAGWLSELLAAHSSSDSSTFWGGFTHAFIPPISLGLRFTSWYSNTVRGDRTQVLYLDHCIFSSKKLLSACGGVPDEPVFEDTLLSKRLKKNGRYQRLKTKVPTSSIRFQKNSFVVQSSINFLSKLMFSLGVPPKTIYRFYEFRNRLN
jgi:hypothetical protein